MNADHEQTPTPRTDAAYKQAFNMPGECWSGSGVELLYETSRQLERETIEQAAKIAEFEQRINAAVGQDLINAGLMADIESFKERIAELEAELAREREENESLQLHYGRINAEYALCRNLLMERTQEREAAERRFAEVEAATIERCAKVCKDDAILCAGQPGGSMRERNEALFLEGLIRALGSATESAAERGKGVAELPSGPDAPAADAELSRQTGGTT